MQIKAPELDGSVSGVVVPVIAVDIKMALRVMGERDEMGVEKGGEINAGSRDGPSFILGGCL